MIDRVEQTGAAERAGREEQRIAREDRRHDEAGFGEDDEEEDAVDPGAVGSVSANRCSSM